MASRENNFMPEFTFGPRTGRIKWNWIMPLDLDRIISENDVETIQRQMEHITYACFDSEDARTATDEGIIKLVTLLQLCVDYVCSMCAKDQELLHNLTSKIEMGRLEAGGQRRPPRRQTLSRERDKVRNQSISECPHCSKRFKNEQYCQQHILRRHHPDGYRKINFIKKSAAMEEGRPYVQDESNHSNFQPEPSPLPSPAAGQALLQHNPVGEGVHQPAVLGAHDPVRAQPLTIDPRSISKSTSAHEHVLVATPPIDTDSLERRIQSHIESGRQVLLDEFRVLVQSHESDRRILFDEVRELRAKHAPVAQPQMLAPAPGAPPPPPVDTEGLERRLQSHIDLVESNQERLFGLIKQELSNASKAPVQSPVGLAPNTDAIQLQTALLEQMQNQTKFLRQQQTTMEAAAKLIVEQPRHAHPGAPPLAAPASSPRRATKDRERRHSFDRRASSSERRPPSSERRSSSERRQSASQALGAGVGSMHSSSPPKKMKMHDSAVKSARRSQSREKEPRRSRSKANELTVKEPDSDSEHSDSEHSDDNRGQKEQPKKKRSWLSRLRPSRAEKPKEEEKPKVDDDDEEDEEEKKKTKEEEEEEVRKEEDEKTMRVVATGIANFFNQGRRGPSLPPLGPEGAQHMPSSPRSSWSSKAAQQPFGRGGGGGAAEATRTQPSTYGGMSGDGGGISPIGGPNLDDDMDMEDGSSPRSGTELWGSGPGRGHRASAAGFGDARDMRQFSRPPAVQTSFGSSRPLQDLSVGSMSDTG